MPDITVTLVDHTGSAGSLKSLIARHLEDILLDLLHVPEEVSAVNMRWMDSAPPADQDLVLHFVESVSKSYVSAKMPGKAHRVDGGGFTRHSADTAGSEFYLLPVIDGKPARFTATGYAKLAAHEAMHNVTRVGNVQMHAQGVSPPFLLNCLSTTLTERRSRMR